MKHVGHEIHGCRPKIRTSCVVKYYSYTVHTHICMNTILIIFKVQRLEAIYLLELFFALSILAFLRLEQSRELFLLLSQDVLLELLLLRCTILTL